MKRCWFCFKNMNRVFVSEYFLHCTNTILFAFTLHRKAEQWLTGRQKIPGIFYIIPMYVAMKGWAFFGCQPTVMNSALLLLRLTIINTYLPLLDTFL